MVQVFTASFITAIQPVSPRSSFQAVQRTTLPSLLSFVNLRGVSRTAYRGDRCRLTVTCSSDASNDTSRWQQSMLPSDPSVPSLSTFYDLHPRVYCHLFLLGFNVEEQVFYVTSHDVLEHPTVRPSYPISSYSLVFPLASESSSPQSVLAVLKDTFTFLYATPFEQDKSFAKASTALLDSLLPTSIRRHLQIDNIRANDIVQQLVKSHSTWNLSNRTETIIRILAICETRVVAAAITERETVQQQENSVCLTGVLYLETRIGKLYGESVYTKPYGVRVDCYFAIALANAARCPCFLSNDLFRSASILVSDMADVYASCGFHPVLPKQSEIQGEGDVGSGEDERTEQTRQAAPVVGEIWQLTADDVLALSEDQLRDALRNEGVAVRNDESIDSLRGKIVPFMDEVHRREVLIAVAAERGMFDVAANLQKGRSKRGKLLQELKDAEADGNWGRVTEVAAQLKRIENKTQDVTMDPGTYNPDLDQDDWYRPCR